MRRSGEPPPRLILFLRSPVPGRTKTRLIPLLGGHGAARLAEAFMIDALAKTATIQGWQRVAAVAGQVQRVESIAGLRHRIEITSQRAGDLGQRMARALIESDARLKAIVGTDIPSIPKQLIEKSLKLTRAHRVVLGPALDGGYYFVGINGEVPDIFSGIKWGTASVLSQTVKRLKKLRVPFAIGPAWYDVDQPSDLALLVQHLKTRPTLRRNCPATVRFLRSTRFIEGSTR